MTARLIVLSDESDFAAWRQEARTLLLEDVAPGNVVWNVSGDGPVDDLFAQPMQAVSNETVSRPAASLSVPRAFVNLAKDAICHDDPQRFAILYRLLWRLMRDKHLMQVAADVDVRHVETLAKAVRRDKHKMTAFVRFREVVSDAGSVWIAWFEPQHHIVEATAPFFVRRFASMQWSILTPRISAHWDLTELTFTSGAVRADAPTEDALEEHWRIYFSSIFNPARLNVSAMQREMPKKYWKNMPEAQLIPDLVRNATQRTAKMIQDPSPPPRVTSLDREAEMKRERAKTEPEAEAPLDLEDLTIQVSACRRCPLWRNATQAVPGAGPRAAEIMFVGEQPGDQEDLQGEPFVGPAGKLLDSALEEAGLPRRAIYLTNAVKHFKFEPRGKRRLHKTPNVSEIDVCRWWLANEIKLVKPKLIVALGASAASSLLQRPVKVTAERGQPLTLPEGPQAMITVHPSYLLRIPDHQAAAVERRRFIDDLQLARRIANDLGAEFAAA